MTQEHEGIAAWQRRPLSSRVGSRRFRRRLVIATYAGWLAVAAIVKLISFGPVPFIRLSLLMVGTNIIIQLMWVDRRTIINTPSLVDAELDERLVQSRNGAFRTAFKVFALLVLIGWAVSIFAATQVLPNDEGH